MPKTPKQKSKTSSVKKPIKKRKYTKKKKVLFSLKQKLISIISLSILVSVFAYGYYLGDKNITNEIVKVTTNKHKETKIEKDIAKKYKSITEKSTAIVKNSIKPKLVIIIDDVHSQRQLNAIKSLNLKVTPSIFPPFRLSPNSNKLAIGLTHYMVHLPMESSSKQFNKQYKTLKVNDIDKNIENRIKELRVLFPTAKYINNHTGSVFTSNYNAMNLAYKYMKKYNFKFIDSKTSSKTKVKKIVNMHKDKYIGRDIFLDNTQNIDYIKKQLRKAVRVAKKNGYAVAIGHPYKSTMSALASSQNILSSVDLVYIDELF